jgi:hypothetical protein
MQRKLANSQLKLKATVLSSLLMKKDGIHVKRETSSDIDQLTTNNDDKQALEICMKS